MAIPAVYRPNTCKQPGPTAWHASTQWYPPYKVRIKEAKYKSSGNLMTYMYNASWH